MKSNQPNAFWSIYEAVICDLSMYLFIPTNKSWLSWYLYDLKMFQMSRSAKVAKIVPLETPDNSSSEDENDNNEQEELQVEFEARAPDEDDFHGIKLLVKQLFLRSAAVNISKVTESILNQRYIGSVIKTVQPEEEEAEDDIAEDDHIYAISTVLNLAEKNK